MKYPLFAFFFSTLIVSFCSCNNGENKKKDYNLGDYKKKQNSDEPDSNTVAGINGKTLFKDYKFGQTMSEIKKTGSFEDCSDFFEMPALCIKNVNFLDDKYDAGLLFEDNVLKSVCLYTEFNEESYMSLPASLEKNNFQLVILQDDKEKIDVIQASKKQTRQNFLDKLTDFENRMLSGNDALIGFLEIKGVKKPVSQYTTSLELISDLPSSAREVDMNIITDDDGKRYLALSFTMVKNSIETLGKKEEF